MAVVRFPTGSSQPGPCGAGGLVQHFTTSVGPLPPTSPSESDIWYDNTQNIWYYYDGSDWLSFEKLTLNFTKDGNADGTFLRVGEVRSITTGYNILRNARLVYISAFAGSGQINKSVELQVNGATQYTFQLDSNLEYINDSVGLDLNQNDKLRLFVSSSGTPIKDLIVTTNICWRI